MADRPTRRLDPAYPATGSHVPADSTGDFRAADSAAAPGPQPRPPAAPPPAFDRYRLRHEIARGGMGIVFAAADEALGREVAVKTLAPQHRGTAAAARFRREAEITARLQHPGIPPVHDLGTLPDGSPFLAMKLIRGRTLAALLKARSSPADDLPRFVQAFEAVCQAVGYAHSQGVVHRDLKPANVMVGDFAEVQVMDWGLAKELGGADPADDGVTPMAEAVGDDDPDRTTDHRASDTDEQTRAGVGMGTPGYMPPEQARGEWDKVDRRADVFSLGAVLCEVLTGRPAFVAKSGAEAVMMAAAADLADAHARLEACGADAELVVLASWCLAADPADRPDDAKAVADAVAAYRAGVEDRLRQAEAARAAAVARAEEQRKRFRLRLALAAAVLLMLAGGAAGGWWYDRVQTNRRIEREAAAARQEDNREKTRRDVTAALTQADALLAQTAGLAANPYQWEATVAAARAAVGQAEGVLNSGEPADDLRAAVAAKRAAVEDADRTRKFVARLEALLAGHVDRLGRQPMDAVYTAAFRDAGLDPDRLTADEFAERVRRHPHAETLTAALWDWNTGGRIPPARYQYLRAATRPLRHPFTLPDRLTPAAAAAWADGLDPAGMTGIRIAILSSEVDQVNPEAARRALEKAVDQYPDDFVLRTKLATRYFAMRPRRLHDAAKHYAAALALRKNSSSAWSNVGMVAIEQKDPKGALAPLRNALRLDPANYLALHHMAAALRGTGDRAAALEFDRRAAALAPGNAVSHYNLGVSLRDNGDPDAALAEFREAVRLDPKLHDAHHNIGVELKRRGDLRGAMAALRTALDLDPDSHNTLAMYGNLLTLQGRHDEARTHLRRAVELDPDDADARAGLGMNELGAGRYADALEHLRAARKLPPSDDQQYPRKVIDDAISLCGTLGELDKRLPAVLAGEEKTDPDELPMFVILCHRFKNAHPDAARLCDRWVKAKGLGNHDRTGARVLGAKSALIAARAADTPPADRAAFRAMALRFMQGEQLTWGLLSQLRADEFGGEARERFTAWLADPDLAVTRHWLGLVRFPPDEREKWAALWKQVGDLRRKTVPGAK